jgi:YVTN family beta-propeller protein
LEDQLEICVQNSPSRVYPELARTLLSAGLAAGLCACAVSAAYAAGPVAPSYRLTNTVALGPGERWDFVVFDPTADRVYVAHGDHVTVVDEKRARVIGQMGTFSGGTHGIAVSQADGQGYTDDGKAGMATAFDLQSLKPVKHILAAPDADQIIREPVTGHIYVINGDSGSITVIDPKTTTAIATIDVGAGLEPGVADGRGMLFVNGVEQHDIVKIDAATNKVEAHWPMPSCRSPHGLAIDVATRRLFATCANNLMVVVDADTGANIATLPIGSFSDGAAFDPARKRIFSSNGDGTLSVIQEVDAQHFTPLETIKTVPGARTMAIDARTGRLFLAAADIQKLEPPDKPGGRPHITFVPNSLKLLYFDPAS